MANSLGYKLFKTECIEDMPFEQFKILLHANVKLAKATDAAIKEQSRSNSKSTTFRISEE